MKLTDAYGDPSGAGWAAIVAAVMLTLTGLVVGISGLCWHAGHVDCLRLHEQTGYPTRMVGTMWGGGCYIFVDGRWIPDTRYRMVDVDQ